MEPTIHSLLPREVPSVSPSPRRRREHERGEHRPFELTGDSSEAPPAAPDPHDAPAERDRSVTPPDIDEAGSRLDVTA